MKLFNCQHCGQLVYFENTRCERCGHRLGFLSKDLTLSALKPAGDDRWNALAAPGTTYRFCANAAYDACNWLVAADESSGYCAACRHNRTIPDLSGTDNLANWQRLEAAKHRLFYTLIALRLPLPTRPADPEGLVFDFLADPKDEAAPKVMTGHDNGLITIALREADDGEREKLRHAMGEPYRTLLGHFRHEVGHFFEDRLVQGEAEQARCRDLFGDEREDYGEALQRHYENGPPADWRERFVSAYASTHAWEDWAESWAHYLHIVDTLETAAAFGLTVRPAAEPGLATRIDFDPHTTPDMTRLIEAWLPLTFAVNSLNRSMGQSDLYPFVLPPPVIEKLGYIHGLVQGRADQSP